MPCGRSSSPDDEALALGTQHGELYVLSLQRPHLPPTPLQRPHAPSAQPHALAAHPTALKFVTVGGDGYLRLWSLPSAGGHGVGPTCSLESMQALPQPGGCVCFDAAGERIAVGEGVAAAGRRPRFYVTSSQLLLLHTGAVGAPGAASGIEGGAAGGGAPGGVSGGVSGGVHGHGCSAIRFSPSGALLAIGTTDGSLHVFDASQGFVPLGALLAADGSAAHAAPVSSIDWTDDSSGLRSGCEAGGLCLWHALARRPASHEELAGDTWATATVPSAWGAQAVWSPSTLDPPRHLAGRQLAPPQVDRSPEGDALVCGDARGHVRMFRYPAVSRIGAGHRRYGGHGAAVDAVAFSWDDRFVFTLGADGSGLVWRHWNEPGER